MHLASDYIHPTTAYGRTVGFELFVKDVRRPKAHLIGHLTVRLFKVEPSGAEHGEPEGLLFRVIGCFVHGSAPPFGVENTPRWDPSPASALCTTVTFRPHTTLRHVRTPFLIAQRPTDRAQRDTERGCVPVRDVVRQGRQARLEDTA